MEAGQEFQDQMCKSEQQRMKTIQSGEAHGRGRELPDLQVKTNQEESNGRVQPEIYIDEATPVQIESKPTAGQQTRDQTASASFAGQLEQSRGAGSSKGSAKEAGSGSALNRTVNPGSGNTDTCSKRIWAAKSGQDKEERWSQGEPIGSCDSPRDMKATSSDDDGDLEEELDDVKDMKGEAVHSQLATDFAKESTESGGHSGPRLQGAWRGLENLDSLPLMKSGYSLEADMKFGWKPRIKGKVLPIPLIFDVEDEYFTLDHHLDPRDTRKGKYPTIFTGWRPADSLKMYRRLLSNTNKYHGTEFSFKIPGELPPAVQKLLDQQMQERILGGSRAEEGKAKPDGMHQEFRAQCEAGEILQFDSAFESGNLDRVVMISPTEYDLYMRPDTNARGHHQWFYFRVTSRSNLGPVRFNILNFTKRRSLYENGMRVCVCSLAEKESRLAAKPGSNDSPLDAELAGWKRGGYDITYGTSKLNKIIDRSLQSESQQLGIEAAAALPRFFQMSFTYDFNLMVQDETYFAYSFPYTFTRLSRFLKELKADPEVMQYTKDCTPLCSSLSGVDVPYLTVTSRVNEPDFEEILESEHSPENLPLLKTKKTVVLTGRVHPGESNSSFMMEGFIKFLTSPTNPVAAELRKRLIFRIIPCTNPDGVIAGNYRVSMSGNDLNRRYQSPHPRLHPIVCAVKKLFRDLKPDLQTQEENQILTFIDMHGHSRKKNVFMYGPGYPIHDVRYLKMRVLPKLMSEQSELFRFYSCKFRIQRSKERTARVVLWREFNIMNCYTLEASFHGFFDKERETKEFVHAHLLKVGKMLANTIFEYILLRDDEERQLKDSRAKREEVKRNKAKVAGAGQQAPKGKEESASKPRDGSQGGGGRAVLSPSASSEAVTNIDDQQPDALANKKINHIRKKLQHAQQNKKQQQTTAGGKEAAQNSATKAGPSGQKKKFKLTKRFKDDLVPHVAPKKRANPNQPPEDAEEAEDAENGQEGSSDQQEQAEEDASKADGEKDGSAVGDLAFVAKFKLNRRTLADLCNQIETDEQKQDKQDEENIEEAGTSDGGVTTDGGRGGGDNYGSDDEANGMLLQQIQGKILGVLKLDAAVPANKPQKPAQNKDQKAKKPNKQKLSQSAVAAAKVPAQPPQAQKSDKKPQSTLKSQESMTKKMLASKLRDCRAPLGGERRSHQTGAVLRRAEDGVPENTRERVRPRLLAAPESQSTPLAFSSATNASAPHPPQQHYPGILLQLTNNNFNDRIMTQAYHKYKKPKYPALSGGLHQLQSLTANAHQLLQKQMQKEKGPGMRAPFQLVDKTKQAKGHQSQGEAGADGKPKYSFYNFQARNGNERSIPLVAGGAGPAEQGMLPSSAAADAQVAERRSHGADPFGVQQSSHRYQPIDQMAQTQGMNKGGRAGRTEFHNFPKAHMPFGAGASISGHAQHLQQLQSQPNLSVHHEAPQPDEVHFYHSHQCTPHLTPQPVKHQALNVPTPQLMMVPDASKPGPYHISSVMHRTAQLENGPPNPLPVSQLQTSAAEPRPGLSAGGLKKRNRRIIPAGEAAAGEAVGGTHSAAPGDKSDLLIPSNQYHDHPESLQQLSHNAALERRQYRRQRKNASDVVDEEHSASLGPQGGTNRGQLQYFESSPGPRVEMKPGPGAPSSGLAGRGAEPVTQSTRGEAAAFGTAGPGFPQAPPMWYDTSQHFARGGRAHLAAIPPQEPRHYRDGGNKQLMSAQPSSAHYAQKDPLLSMPQSKPHSVHMQELSAPARTAYKAKGGDAATAGDYQLVNPPLLDQTKSEYADKQEKPLRPQRQAHSHRKEARFEYPALSAGQQQIYQTTNIIPSHQEVTSSMIHGTPGEPRSKDLEVLRSVEQAAAMLTDQIPKSSSTVVKPSRSIAKDQNKEAQKATRSQNQRGIMVRGIGAPRVTSHGPFTKDSTSQGAISGLQRDTQHPQFASQLSLLKESNFQSAGSNFQSATMYNPSGFQTRMLVATNVKAAELPAQKHFESQEQQTFQIRKQQSILKPVLGATSLQRKIVQSAVNEKIHNRANLLIENQGFQRYQKVAAETREPVPIDPREQMYQDEQALIKSMHVSDREMMQQLAKQRHHNNPNWSAQPQMSSDAWRPSPQNTYGEHKAGQSFSYNPLDKGYPLAEPAHLPKSKGQTLVQTGKSHLAYPVSMSREVMLRQNQNLVMFMDGDVDGASNTNISQDRAPAGNANVFDILHRQDLHQQRQHHHYDA